MVDRGRVVVSGEANMEKLELLSQTAMLKQGIDGRSSRLGGDIGSADNINQSMPGIPISAHTKNLLSAAAVARAPSIPLGNNGERRSRTTSPSSFSVNTTTVGGRRIASPVSTDGEDEDVAGDVARGMSIVSTNIKPNTKASIVESRSPVTTLECAHHITAAPSSPFPSSPPLYSFGYLSNHNQMLQQHQPQEHHDYSASLYHNHHGSIIRTLSEASFAPPYSNNLMATNANTGAPAPTVAMISSENGAAFQPLQRQQGQLQPLNLQQRSQQSHSHGEMAQQIRELKEQLSEKDLLMSSLQNKVNCLENQIHELRQLPTGKISHIPVHDMIRIMQEYGSEVSNQTLPQQRKHSIKKASIVRQFRRWNPNFFHFFLHHNGEWVPKLGREGELRRRAEKRRLLLIAKQSNSANASR
mmetsp:Transcript_9204/g.22362  ORF Transcript_9204/g.22362 Transcript_9204/m.22362 type:complete len:414 (+) Transcript_9204:161-1402(+)